jgi:hypothetical protein
MSLLFCTTLSTRHPGTYTCQAVDDICTFQQGVLGHLQTKKSAWWHSHAKVHKALGCDMTCEIVKRE